MRIKKFFLRGRDIEAEIKHTEKCADELTHYSMYSIATKTIEINYKKHLPEKQAEAATILAVDQIDKELEGL